MNQLRKLASYVVDSSLKPSATSPPQQNSNLPPVPSYKHLDLTYVTTRLLVGGRAVDGPTDKMSCVNNATEMKAYLDAAHNGKYVVFNLTDDNADAPVISPQTLDFTWERDGGIRTYTPPADHIFRICYAIFAWLALDAENVALLYCHNGKTRSGVICACYFLFVRTVDDPMSALAQFYQKRLGIDTLTPEYVKRSMPISIQRFVSNFSIIMNAQTIPNPEPLLLKAIMFRALPVEMAPLVQLWDDDKMVFSTAATDDVAKPVIDWNPEEGFLAILWESGIPLDGGFSILCSFGDDYQADTSSDPTSRVLFRYMNSTWFLSAGLVTLKKPCLDMMKQYEHGFDEDNFSVDMVFHDNPTVEPKPFVPVNYTGNYAVKQGIVEMASHHTIAPDPSMYLNFIKTGFDATASTFALQRAENAPNLALDILHSEGISTIFTRLLPLPSHPSPSKLAATGAGLKGFTGSSSNLLQSTTDEAIRFHTTTAVATEWSASPNVSRRQSTHVDGILRGDVRTNVDLSRRHSSTDSAPPPRCKPSTTIEANSAVNYQEAVCAVCREEDYVLRPQLVRCAGGCQHFFHTGCAGLKKIPFGLTTMSDRANHAAYMKKFFSTWTCADCTCQHRADAPLPSDSPQSKSSPTKQKLEKLRLLLDEKGLSLDDLLRVADAKAPSGNSTPTAAAGADDASLAKYERMIDNGVPLEAAQNCMVRDGVAVDPSRLATYAPSKPLAHQLAQHKQSDVLLLKDAIQFEGYFTMLQKGISKDAVKHKMKMCGLNPDILNLDPNSVYMEVRDKIEMLQAEYTQPPRSPPKAPSPQKPSTSPHKPTVSLPSPNKSTTAPATTIHRVENPPTSATTASATSAGPPGKHEDEPEKAPAPDSPMADGKLTLKDDPTYGKYFKMLKLNIPQEAVRLKMVEHGVNPHALVLGPSALVSELNSTTTSPKPAVLKDDPIYAKYFKMLKLNIPEEAVRLKMKEHGVNEKALELGPDGLVSDLTTPDGLPGKPLLLKDDPVYGKYFKMLKMNIPEGAVKQKMIEHGVNVKALELGPDGLVSDLTCAAAKAALLKDDPVYGKYFKMLKMNIPEGAVKQKMIEHGVNVKALELGPDGLVSDLTCAAAKAALLKDDPVYGKYFKMLKMNIPEGAVKQKMIEHGVNVKALELGPDGLVSDLTCAAAKAALLKDDPVYGKYFKMLKMNIPEGAVKQKMIEHGVNVKALELGPDGLVSDLTSPSSPPPKPAKKAVRRKKLFWQALPEDRLRRASSTIWEDKDHNIQFDMDEIETLFFKETTVVKKPVAKPLARKQAVTLVDGKRAMNAAIALARIKQSYADLAKAILTYDAMGLTLEQLTTIHEFLPTDEEVGIVQRYSGDPSVLGEAEKFFAAIATVPRFAIKMDCLVSKQAFAAHVTDLTTSISNVIHACEDVKASRLLKLLLGTVLKLGNTLNGGDETEHAVRGFSVDSLLRLGHTKTNDQKTTVLHYLVRVLRKNQPHVLEFQTELQHVSLAAREPVESIDQLFSALDSDVKKTADECRRMQQDNAESSVVQSMQASIAASTHQLDALQQRMAAMKHELTTVFEYFGEDPAKKPTEFFLTLSSFCTAFDKAKQEVVAAEEAKQRAERSSQAMRPRATTDAAVMLDPVDKAKLISAKNSFSFHTTKLPSKTSTTTDLDRTASSRF